VEHALLQPETLQLIAGDPRLAEQYRQAVVNYQVADLLDVRALSAPEQAATWRRRAADRRELGDRLMRVLLDGISAERPTSSTGLPQSVR
jgi:hypothetical protein